MFNAYEGFDFSKQREEENTKKILREVRDENKLPNKPWDKYSEENILQARRERALKAKRLRRQNKL